MTITVNGIVHKIKLGCRTFISVSELLETLQADTALFNELELNEKTVGKRLFPQTNVTNGDRIGFAHHATAPGAHNPALHPHQSSGAQS